MRTSQFVSLFILYLYLYLYMCMYIICLHLRRPDLFIFLSFFLSLCPGYYISFIYVFLTNPLVREQDSSTSPFRVPDGRFRLPIPPWRFVSGGGER